jgi:hypothetical protein
MARSEPGAFRDGKVAVTSAKLAVWKIDPDALFELMRATPIGDQPKYVLGKRTYDRLPADADELFYKSSNDTWSLGRDPTTGARAVIAFPQSSVGWSDLLRLD